MKLGMTKINVKKPFAFDVQFVVIMVLIFWPVERTETKHNKKPCFHCDMFNLMQGDQASQPRQVKSQCQFPCKCSVRELKCRAGVNTVKDGCDCCYMCARQQGDMCGLRDMCDEEKGLYCDFKYDEGTRGICRARNAKTCNAEGRMYRDGEEFKPDCRRLCTCQNGQYSCSTLCPQEDRRPSSHCKYPRLINITGKCCREWSCPVIQDLSALEEEPEQTTSSGCKKETTNWSSCSQTCGMGVSFRFTNNNEDCHPVKQQRLCMVRPCELNDKHMTGQHCKSTWKSKSIKIKHGDCTSVREHRPKYCSTCKRGKCCGPGRAKTIGVDFLCADGRTTNEPFMWIKNCECHIERRCPWQ